MMGYYGVVPSKPTLGCVQTMDRKEILEKLKSTEAEIRSNIDAAQHKRNEVLTHAQKQAQKLEKCLLLQKMISERNDSVLYEKRWLMQTRLRKKRR
jgi:vacuolar-type H+-ATPase subunit H